MLSISCHYNNDYNDHTMEQQATRVSYTPNPSLGYCENESVPLRCVCQCFQSLSPVIIQPFSPLPITQPTPPFRIGVELCEKYHDNHFSGILQHLLAKKMKLNDIILWQSNW